MSRRFSTPRLIVYGFLALMGLGTVLLKLPASTQDGISWVDAFFVSVSAGSVTGLSTVTIPTTFAPFGQVVMMVLVQLGGLGGLVFLPMRLTFCLRLLWLLDLLKHRPLSFAQPHRTHVQGSSDPRNVLSTGGIRGCLASCIW